MEENSLVFSANIETLKNYFMNVLFSHGDTVSYEKIKLDTGIEVRSQLNQNGYQACLKARELCEALDKDAFSVKPIRGHGLQRVRLGISGHAQPNSWLQEIRRKSERALTLTSRALRHAEDDGEAVAIRAQTLIHSDIVNRSHTDEYRHRYTHISNGESPQRPLVSMREVLQRANKDRQRT